MDSINNTCKLGSDAWLELQAFKTRQLNRREKLSRHKNLNSNLFNGTSLNQTGSQYNPNLPASSSATTNLLNSNNRSSNGQQTSSSTDAAINRVNDDSSNQLNNDKDNPSRSTVNLSSRSSEKSSLPGQASNLSHSHNLELVECLLLLKLCDVALKLPIDSRSLQRSICKIRNLENTPKSLIENLLQKFAHQELISIEEPTASIHTGRRRNLIDSDTFDDDDEDDESCIYVTSADHTKLVELHKSFGSLENIKALLVESRSEEQGGDEIDSSFNRSTNYIPTTSAHDDRKDLKSLDARRASLDPSRANNLSGKSDNYNAKGQQDSYDLESLLSLSSTRERESKKLGEELLELLSKPTAKEKNLLEKFRSADGYQVQEFCPKGTKGECSRNSNGAGHCKKLHFKKIIARHTEETLGDCSFLNTCFHMDSCKYVHYEVDYDDDGMKPQDYQFKRPYSAKNAQERLPPSKQRGSGSKNNPSNSSTKSSSEAKLTKSNSVSQIDPHKKDAKFEKTQTSQVDQLQVELTHDRKRFKTILCPPQWIQCDLRFFDMSLLGKFSVVMADPPWDIHMELPYGTMSDDEMRKLNIPTLQDEGVIFLWVTGRAMELGRECLALWGYERCDEIIWVKTNQLQRIIRTGRTGHWLNHGKEHCLVGVKGNPRDINRGLDCDVIVAEVRATSHKPDEIYGIIERLSPGTRKIELFGRAHNVQPNWITLGNQLNGVHLIEPNLVSAFRKLNLPYNTADQPA